ncbi:hypothetical protein C3V39_04675 [Prevotella sp. oral taxon 820]|nr:hypothetical protein C3V39_04675 [Prevotella sp. oral taxon 820]
MKSLIKKHATDKQSKGFNTWSYLVSMIFCQFADCVSLREISFTSIDDIYRTLNYLYIYHQKSGIILKKKREGRK